MANLDPLDLTNFWNAAHKANKHYPLTGSELAAPVHFLNLKPYLKPGTDVLNIGVGFGYDTRALHHLGLRVSALDISPLALKRVQDVVKSSYTPDRLDQLPTNQFDLIISYLVAQHMSNRQLKAQLRACIRSLTPQGVFALQFAVSPLTNYHDDTRLKPALMQGGFVTRTPQFMRQLIATCDGHITWQSWPVFFPWLGMSWYGIHIQKKTVVPKQTSFISTMKWAYSLYIYWLGLMIRRALL